MAENPRISLLEGGKLTIGRSGNATVEKTIDPEAEVVELDHTDVFNDLKVIPVRSSRSNITVRGLEARASNYGLHTRLAWYAEHGGRIDIGGVTYVVTEFDGEHLTAVNQEGYQIRKNINGIRIKFLEVEPTFEERRTPTIRLQLGNVKGRDKLHLRAQVQAASGRVSHEIFIRDAKDQKKIQADYSPMLAVTNGTQVEFQDMALSLRLNEAMAKRPPFSRASAGARTDAFEVGEVSEAAASGILTMPVASHIDLRPGETRQLNISAAIKGTPDKAVDFIRVMLEESLILTFSLEPGKVGVPEFAKGNPSASYRMSGTDAPQPAGIYELWEGTDLAGTLNTSQYVEKKTPVDIPGSILRSIEASLTVETAAIEEGTWADMVDLERGEPSRRTRQQSRVNRFTMRASLDLESKSRYDRELTLRLDVSAFDTGIDQIQAKLGDRMLRATWNQQEQVLVVEGVTLAANSKGRLELSFLGRRTETREVPME